AGTRRIAIAGGVAVDLGKLAARQVVVGQEAGDAGGTLCRLVVAIDDATSGQAFHVDPVGTPRRHIGKGLLPGGDHVQDARRVGDDLGHLPTCDVVVGMEAGRSAGAHTRIRVAADHAVAVQTTDVDIEGVIRVHIR